MTKLTSSLIAAAMALSACVAGATEIRNADSTAGTILADSAGMSLYVFDKDTPAVSNCYGDCAFKWPPHAAGDSARPEGEYGIVLRTDVSRQWTYQGRPLYTWFKDEKPGDITGDGVKGVWHLARP